MTADIALTLGIIVVAVVLFASEKLRVDVIAMLVLLTLALTGLVNTDEAFSGFSSAAVITVWAVYIVSGALFKTGVADFLGAQIARLAGNDERRLVVVIMLTVGIMSGFMNNIGATAVLLPAVVGISRQTKIPASKLLIPLSFASLMGGELTIIGTPPNILANDILASRGLRTLGFFEITPLGAIVFGTGILYMVFIGRHILPARQRDDELPSKQQLRQYISEVRVLPDSLLNDRTLMQSGLGADYDLTVIAIDRQMGGPVVLHRDTRIQANDLLIVQGLIEDLWRARDELGLVIEGERILPSELEESENVHFVEATVAPRSHIVGRSLREMRFRDQFGLTALAIWRHGEVITQRLRDVRLQFGDTLLLQGAPHRFQNLQESGEFLVLEVMDLETRRRDKAIIAVAVMGLVLALVTLADFHISTSLVIGSILMVLTGCLTMDEAYESIEWRSVFLIAGMLPLGIAMDTTGTARFLADLMIDVMGGLGPRGVLAGVYILAALITEPMSNAAATVLVTPIAIDTAIGLGASPHTFVLAVVIGAATSFLTPVGHQANVLVFGPGGYRFFDYTRVGAPLNVALFAATMVFLPILWPMFP